MAYRKPPPLETPKRFPPKVVDLMLELESDGDVKTVPQTCKEIPWEKAGRLRKRLSKRGQAKSGRGRPVLHKEFHPADVALWIALGHSHKFMAQKLKCHLGSLAAWLTHNPQVRETAKAIRKELLDRVEGSIVRQAGRAVLKLSLLMENSQDEEIQMRSAKILLDKAFELRPERKAPLVAIQNNTHADLRNVPSTTLHQILAEELAARNGQEQPAEPTSSYQDPPETDNGQEQSP